MLILRLVMEKQTVKIDQMPIDQYLKQIDPKIKQSVLELIEKIEEASGMKKDDMELVVNQRGDNISVFSLTLNPHLRELGGDNG